MKKKTAILWLLILIKFAIQYFLISPQYDLHRDEYLHLDQGRHLAWGFISVPPVTSWISYLIRLLGNSVFWIKFFPALFGALTMAVVWKIVEALKGGIFACFTAALAVTFSVIFRINILYQPNSLDILFWTLLFYIVTRYIDSGKSKWLYATAIVLAFGFLNKYNIVFLVIGMVPAILLTKHRVVFNKRDTWLAALLAFLIISPNLFWQWQQHFPVVHHLRELADTQLVNVDRMGFVREQVLFFFGSIFIIITAFISFFAYPPFHKYRVFFFTFVITMLIFVWFKAKAYYAIGLYPVMLAFGSVYLEHLTKHGLRIYWRPVMVLIILLAFIPLLRIAFPILGPEAIVKKKERYQKFGLLRWEDGKDHLLPQDFADMLGWHELAHKVDSAYEFIDDNEHTLVICDNYGEAGAVNYYSTHKDIGAVSMNADYINWFPLDTKEIRNLILVKDIDDDDKGRQKEKPYFQEIQLIGKIDNHYAREFGTSIYILKGAKISINDVLRKEIAKRRTGRE